jgi:hypothetical protein
MSTLSSVQRAMARSESGRRHRRAVTRMRSRSMQTIMPRLHLLLSILDERRDINEPLGGEACAVLHHCLNGMERCGIVKVLATRAAGDDRNPRDDHQIIIGPVHLVLIAQARLIVSTVWTVHTFTHNHGLVRRQTGVWGHPKGTRPIMSPSKARFDDGMPKEVPGSCTRNWKLQL